MMANDGKFWLCFRSFYYDEKGVEIGSQKENFGPFSYTQALGLFCKFNSTFLCKLIADKYIRQFYSRVSWFVKKCNLKIFVSYDPDKDNVYSDLVVNGIVKYDPYFEEDDDLPF